MKLPIKKKYFEQILNGTKTIDFRDAHITFICEETGREIKKEIEHAMVTSRPEGYDDVLQDPTTIQFWFKQRPGRP